MNPKKFLSLKNFLGINNNNFKKTNTSGYSGYSFKRSGYSLDTPSFKYIYFIFIKG